MSCEEFVMDPRILAIWATAIGDSEPMIEEDTILDMTEVVDFLSDTDITANNVEKGNAEKLSMLELKNHLNALRGEANRPTFFSVINGIMELINEFNKENVEHKKEELSTVLKEFSQPPKNVVESTQIKPLRRNNSFTIGPQGTENDNLNRPIIDSSPPPFTTTVAEVSSQNTLKVHLRSEKNGFIAENHINEIKFEDSEAKGDVPGVISVTPSKSLCNMLASKLTFRTQNGFNKNRPRNVKSIFKSNKPMKATLPVKDLVATIKPTKTG